MIRMITFMYGGFTTRQIGGQDNQKRRQHHHADHLRNDCGVGCIVADRMGCGDHLSNLMYGRAGEDAVRSRRHIEPLQMGIQMV